MFHMVSPGIELYETSHIIYRLRKSSHRFICGPVKFESANHISEHFRFRQYKRYLLPRHLIEHMLDVEANSRNSISLLSLLSLTPSFYVICWTYLERLFGNQTNCLQSYSCARSGLQSFGNLPVLSRYNGL